MAGWGIILAVGFGSSEEDEKKQLIDDNVVALDAALESRWRHEQGPEGLIQLVTDAIDSMIEIRMVMEYGDYLALQCEALNQGDMRRLLWKTTTGCDWKIVANKLREEEKALDIHQENPNSPVPETPWLNDIKTAVERKGLNLDQTIFEIKGYGDRNAMAHIGIERMIDECVGRP